MGEKLEAGAEYRGPCGVLKDSNWLSAETIPADREIRLAVGIEIAGSEIDPKVAGCFAGDNDISRSRRARDGSVIVKNIGTTGEGPGRIAESTHSEIYPAIGIEISSG